LNEPTIAQTVLFPDLADRPLIATFDQPHASSDGGAILLKAAERRLGLLAAFTATVPDLFQELQLRAERTALRGAQVPRLRQALITIGVQVVRSVRRIVLHFPRSHPDALTWARLARVLGAAPA
jgi:hypothetical protein